jgi:hypothetical protein
VETLWNKLVTQKRAARKVAEIVYTSLQKFSEEEQEQRMKEIHKIALKAGANPNRKSSKQA